MHLQVCSSMLKSCSDVVICLYLSALNVVELVIVLCFVCYSARLPSSCIVAACCYFVSYYLLSSPFTLSLSFFV